MTARRKWVAGALAVGLLAAGLAVSAADGPPGRMGREAGVIGMPLRGLDLTGEQRAAIRDLRERHGAGLRASLQRVRAAQVAQRQAAIAVPVDEAAVRVAAREVADARAEALILGARLRDEVWPILTAEQQARVTAALEGRGERMRERRQAMPDRRPGGRRGPSPTGSA